MLLLRVPRAALLPKERTLGSPTPSLYIPTTRRLEQYLDAAAVWEEGGAVGLESSSRQQ